MSAIPRNEGESFEDYKIRREADHQATYNSLYYGKTFWDSYYDGTYYNPERKAKKARRITPHEKATQVKHMTA